MNFSLGHVTIKKVGVSPLSFFFEFYMGNTFGAHFVEFVCHPMCKVKLKKTQICQGGGDRNGKEPHFEEVANW